jgi:autophagy-related protein 13
MGGNGASAVGSASASSSESANGPMLTNESDVEERLRQMNIAFLASLEGLGGRRERREGPGSSEGSSRPGSAREGSGGRRGRSVGSEGRSGGGGVAASRDDGTSEIRRNVGNLLLLGPPDGSGSGSASVSSAGVGQGSEEVIGRLELDDDRRRGRGK